MDSLARAVRAGTPAQIRAAVNDFGWRELLEEDVESAVSIIMKVQGAQLLPTSFLDEILAEASGLEVPDDTRVVLPPLGELEPASRLVGAAILIDGVVNEGSDRPLLVPCRTDSGIAFARSGALTTFDTSATLDPESGWAMLTATLPRVDVLCEGEEAAERWKRVVAAGHRALSHELVAVGAEMLRLAVEHVVTRRQFGQPIGQFQAVKHRLADVRLWQEVSQLSSEAAWEDSTSESAALAKAAACRFTAAAREHCQQVLGGMGFSWEHDFHRYLKRALVLEPLLGGAAVQHRHLGARLQAGGIPRTLAAL
jgi:hypothetical protein